MTRATVLLAACSALLPTAATALPGPTAAEILKKSQAIVDSAKTFQATVLMTNDAGSRGSMSTRMDVKTAGSKSSIVSTVIGQPTGQLAMMAMGSGTRIVDDGKTMTIYNPGMKVYFKRPSSGKPTGITQFKDLGKVSKDANITLTGTQNIAGKPAWVISITPKKATKGGPEKATLYIDQATYHLRSMVMKSNVPAGRGGPQQAVTMKMQIQNEKYNEAIPDSAFAFVPPPGAKEMDPAAMMGAMGAMGGQGRPGGGAAGIPKKP